MLAIPWQPTFNNISFRDVRVGKRDIEGCLEVSSYYLPAVKWQAWFYNLNFLYYIKLKVFVSS